MQPVQDLTVEDRVSRTQYQYSLEDPDATQLSALGDRLLDALRTRPELRDVASDQQNGGLRADGRHRSRHGRRASASRRSMIDDTLYNAFGQRQVSTIFTQLNQYHVVLEVQPEFRARARCALTGHLRPLGDRDGQVAAERVHARSTTASAPLAINHQGQFPAVTLSFNLAPGASLGEAVNAIEARRRQDIGLAAEHSGRIPGNGAGFQASLANEPLLILAAS